MWLRVFRQRLAIGKPLLFALAVFAIGFAAGYWSQSYTGAHGSAALKDAEPAFEPFWDAFTIIESRYLERADVSALVDGAIKGHGRCAWRCP